MTAMQIPSDVVGARIKELRQKRRWSLADLAHECREKAGADQLTENVIENIEHGRKKDGRRRRTVTVDELLIFAYVFNVGVVHLLVPTEGAGPYPATPSELISPVCARDWIRGRDPLPSFNPRTFFSEVPAAEFVNARLAEAREQGRPTMSDVQAPETDRVDVRRSQHPAEDGDDGQG